MKNILSFPLAAFMAINTSMLAEVPSNDKPVQKLQAIQLQQQNYLPKLRLKGLCLAAESTALRGSGRYSILAEVIADGSHVKKGQIIARFIEEAVKREIAEAKEKVTQLDLEMTEDLISIENDQLKLEDELENFRQTLTLRQAELLTLQNLPDKRQLLILAEEIKVAKLKAEARNQDLKRGELRFERELISKAELEDLRSEKRQADITLALKQHLLKIENRGAEPADLQVKTLEITNTQLEIKRLEKQFADSREFSLLRKNVAQSKLKNNKKKLERVKKQLDSIVFRAPHDGIVQHVVGREPIQAGTVIYWGREFLRIPDLTSLAFDIYIPEKKRKYFAVGDSAEIDLMSNKLGKIQGKISEISRLPEDVSFRFKQSWGKEQVKTGVKYYKATVIPSEMPAGLKPNMSARITLNSSKERSGLALPPHYVHYRKGQPHISVDGKMRLVEGQLLNGNFLIDADSGLSDKKIDTNGDWQELDNDKKNTGDNRFYRAQGELTSINPNEVIIPDIGPKARIIWMKEEESLVKKGEVIMRVDPTELQNLLSTLNNTLKDKSSALKKEQQNLANIERSSKLKQELLINQMKIAELRFEQTNNKIDEKKLENQQASVLGSQLELERAQSELRRLEKIPAHLSSKREKSRQIRQVETRKLNLKQAELNLKLTQRGRDKVQRKQAELELLKAQVKRKQYISTLPYNISDAKTKVEEARFEFEKTKAEISLRQQQMKNTSIPASADGILQYNKIWGSGGLKKPEPGMSVSPMERLMAIPAGDSMAIRVELPESLFSKIRLGMAVQVRIPSIGSQMLEGKISALDYAFINQEQIEGGAAITENREPDGITQFAVYIRLSTAAIRAKSGSIAEVEFPLEMSTKTGEESK